MHTTRHQLIAATPGTAQSLISLHYGTPGRGSKVVIQASLHADEVPGMLVAHHLRGSLADLETQGRLRGEIVLVPAANPIGLFQWHRGSFHGRFDDASGDNFNRQYADLTETVAAALKGRMSGHVVTDVALVRGALCEAIAAWPATSNLESLRRVLLGLAIDADIVIDLHSDGEAVLHLYTTPGCWPEIEPLARHMGAEAALLAERSGGDPFDEACSMVWPALAERLGIPLPQACAAVTVELRGEADVRHDLAEADARGILQFLTRRGLIEGAAEPLPALRRPASPLAGSIPIVAPHGGVVVFARTPGDTVAAGDPIAELIEPLTGTVTTLTSPVDGLFFARDNRRFAHAGMRLGKVAGSDPTRQGRLLSP